MSGNAEKEQRAMGLEPTRRIPLSSNVDHAAMYGSADTVTM
jgi:hypothetical protein